MKNQCALPKFLQPKKSKSLKRIGKNNDGGYVVDEKNILNSDALIGLGMSDDWSFEENFNLINSVPTFIYDNNVDFNFFLKKCKKYIIRINKPRIFLHWLNVALKYKKFFRDNKFHHKKLIGFNLPPNFVSLGNILAELKRDKFLHIYLKIDIEGWEYRVLEDLISYSEIIEGLAIEFHDVDLHIDKIEDFISKFSLNLIHTHCNNYSQINENKTPLAIECTFSCEPSINELAKKFPNALDMPNNPNVQEYFLSFLDN